MNKSNISETLKKLLFEHSLKPADLARLTNLPQPTVQKLVAGTSSRPYEKSLVPIANYFNISLEQLRGEKPILNSAQTQKTLQELGVSLVALLDWSEVQEWIGNPTKRKSPKTTIATNSKVNQNSFALAIKDASMEPLFPDQTIIICNPEAEAKDRHYVLVMLKNHKEPVFRQLLIDAGDKFIKPLSPDLEHYRMNLLDDEDKIIGILVEAKQQYAI